MFSLNCYSGLNRVKAEIQRRIVEDDGREFTRPVYVSNALVASVASWCFSVKGLEAVVCLRPLDREFSCMAIFEGLQDFMTTERGATLIFTTLE
jgi:hypothetical protein